MLSGRPITHVNKEIIGIYKYLKTFFAERAKILWMKSDLAAKGIIRTLIFMSALPEFDLRNYWSKAIQKCFQMYDLCFEVFVLSV